MDFETARLGLEELERIELALAERIVHDPDWLDETKISRELAMQRLEASVLVKRYREITKQIELEKLSEIQVPSLDEFLDTVNSIEESGPAADLEKLYSRHAKARGLDRFKCDFTADMNVDSIFSLPESYGKLLDLTMLHQAFLNIPGAPHVTFKEYVGKLGSFDDILYIPVKEKREFSTYLADLEKYLIEVYHKTHPFDEPLNLAPQENTSALWCAVCQKLYASEGVFKAHFDGKKHKRAAQNGPASVGDAGRVATLCELLQPQLLATKTNISRQEGMTHQEREIENQVLLEKLDQQDNYVSEDELEPEHDSAPSQQVPAWLAKINGLHLQFPCEICGGTVYHGPKAFEKHFSESKHIHGLRCLGISDASVYAGITSISEATDLYKKLAKSRKIDAEVEDEQGNVMTARAFQDLKRQGLI
ncbi:Pre-mRNA-splicing factor sap61 [Wickerhamiella sorbophila]|uniref:Pre-mRNA-splicing factor sap61 n=1 Tax=Wickerhamiella sorbophila TaxID=45607 RepID=A0A2T0FHI3_9ASCO|nr:Pre-mRNA-splicing factor sap61 [Wickerhamiella sorbophila]PRT54417.1 Pre-mRNA-splicing factor sap61 [Wickerhamiella sorbophila]